MDLIGKVGVIFILLCFVGIVIIDDECFDVVLEGLFIEKDKKVKVVKVEGLCIVVREI